MILLELNLSLDDHPSLLLVFDPGRMEWFVTGFDWSRFDARSRRPNWHRGWRKHSAPARCAAYSTAEPMPSMKIFERRLRGRMALLPTMNFSYGMLLAFRVEVGGHADSPQIR
jgi:hypothetical protein